MKTLKDLLASIDNAGQGFAFEGGILKAAAEKVIAEHTERAITACQSLISTIYTVKDRYVNALRVTREAEALAKKSLVEVEKAVQHFIKTENPLPFLRVTNQMAQAHQFCAAIRISVPPLDSDAWKC